MSKPRNNKPQDPHAAREAKNYDNPVPSREFILQTLIDLAVPSTFEEVCSALHVDDEDRTEGVRRRLIAMARDAQIDSNRGRQTYFPLDPKKIAIGMLQGHKDGYGFLIREEGDDVYISNNQMRKAFHGDKAMVRITGTDRRGRLEGQIAKVVEYNTTHVVGRYFEQAGGGIVRPDSKRISHEVVIAAKDCNGAKHDQFVNVEIINQPRAGEMITGRITEVLGNNLAPGMEIEVAIRSHDIPNTWTKELLEELKSIPEEVIEKDKKKRIDLRDLPFVTIDGEDARDFDDAVYVEKDKSTNDWRLFVAIADVSHYVPVGSELDKEATNRATSVYFPENVVPMLPEIISNGLCSLNPEVDRLVMVCEVTISDKGNMSGYKFFEAVIHSHARLTYNLVWDMLQKPMTDDGKKWRKHYRPIVPHLETMYSLYKILRKGRTKRGAIDFETQETRIEFDSERKISQIVPTSRNDAHMIIEECMLMANVCAADFLSRYNVPALFRVHNGPSDQKLDNLREFLGEMGLSMAGGDPSPSHYQALLKQIADRPDAKLIQTVMLRSLSQAVYQPENEGHFGLAFDAYAHFTSPIRRYPDLLVHRAIRSVIRSTRECKHVRRVEGAGRLAKKVIFPYDVPAMVTLGENCSMAERRADDATRDVVDFLKCEYMEQHVGEVFDGTISAVTGFGMFVSLDDVFVEGLVHISNLANDFYQFDSVKHRLVGERTRRTFRLGDKVSIQVMSVSLDDRKIDFALAGELPTGQNTGQRTNKKPSAGKKEHKRPVSRRPISFESAADNTPDSDAKTEGGEKSGEQKRRGPRRNGRKKLTNAGSTNKSETSNSADQKANKVGGSNSVSSKTDKPAKKKKRPMSKRQKMNGAEAKSKSQSADASSKSKTRKPKKSGSAKKKVKKSNAKAHIA
ncbi:MAG: ribonuclease R [Oleispira sp.]